jgi:peptide/nickel transport system substrate-binding protein
MRLTKNKLTRGMTILTGAVIAAGILTYAGAAAPQTSQRGAGKFVVHEATTLAIPNIDGIMSNSVESTHQLYPSLTRITGGGGVGPDLATSWSSNTDGTQWTFKLRPGVKNSDGTPLTANDIVWTFNTVMSTPTSLVRQNIAPYMGADSISASGNTITFNLTTPMATWARQCTLVPVVSQAEYTKIGAAGFATHPVGAGPYEVVGFNPNVRLVLKANPYYYGGKPPVTYVTEDIVADETARLNALKSGAIDVATLSPITAPSAASDKSLTVKTVPSNNVSFLGFNVTNPQLSSPDLRQAINLAIDRAAIAKSIYGGVAVPSGQLLAPVSFGYSPNIKAVSQDINQAKALVQKSGYSGQTLNFNYPTGSQLVPGADQLAQAIQGYLQQVGINTNLISEDTSTFLGDWFGKRFSGLYLMSFQPSTLDGALVYNLLMHSANYARDANAEQLFTSQSGQPSVKQRHDILVTLGQSLVQSDLWFVPIVVNGRTYAWNPSKVRLTPRADGYLYPQFFKRPKAT